MSKNIHGKRLLNNTKAYIRNLLKAKYSKILVCSALGLICLIPFLVFSITLKDHYAFYPVSGDPGEKLALGYALFERNTFIDYNPWQYPPLSTALLYIVAKLTSDAVALHWFSPLFLSVLPITMFLLAKYITNRNSVAFFASILISTTAVYYRMYSWGGWPNLLGLFLLPVEFHYILKFMEEQNLRHFALCLAFTILIILTHHLTTMVLIGTLGLYTLFSALMRKKIHVPLLLLTVTSIMLMIYRALVGANQFVFFNEAAWFTHAPSWNVILWTFDDRILMILMTALAVVGLKCLWTEKRETALLLASWTLAPYLFWVAWGLKIIAIDNHRFPLFSLQPLLLTISYAIHSFVSEDHGKQFPNSSKTVITATVLITVLIFGNILTGPISFITWHSSGDSDEFSTCTWIKNHIAETEVIATRAGVMSRWVQGLAHRTVITYAPPEFLYIKGQYEQALAAEALLTTKILVENSAFRVKDQTPSLFEKVPWVFLYDQGKYKCLGFFCDCFLTIKYGMNQTDSPGFGFPFQLYSVNQTTLSYMISYETPHFHITKTTSLAQDDTLKIMFTIVELKEGEIHSIAYRFTVLSEIKPVLDEKTLATNIGSIEVITNASEIELRYAPARDQYDLNMIFQPQGKKVNIEIMLKAPNVVRMVKHEPILLTQLTTINKYDVSHVLVETSDAEAVRWLNNEPDRFKLVYENPKYLIYKVLG